MRFALVRRLSAAAIAAAVFAVSITAATQPTVKFTDTKLKNGLRVIVSEDHVAPVFSVAVIYNVGSRDERPGRTGFAHLFEHMMFKGSENVGPGEHFYSDVQQRRHHERHDEQGADALLRDAAGQSARHGAVPRGGSHAVAGDQQGQPRQPAATPSRKSAGRASTISRTARTFEAIDELAYENLAYKHSVIGSMADLNAASVEDVAAFFKTYYAPNNAILAIVRRRQRRDRDRARAEVLRSRSRRSPTPPPVDVTEPPQKAERRLHDRRPARARRRVDIAYRIPSSLSPDDDAIDRAGGDSGQRPQLAALRGARPRRSSSRSPVGRLRREQPRPAAVPHRRDGSAWQDARRRRSRHLRGNRAGEGGADRRLGDREGAQRRAAPVRRQR